MAKSTPYDEDPERYSYASDEDLKRWYRQSNTLGKRLSSAEGLTLYFFLWSSGITVVGSLLTLLIHSWIGSWIVLLVGGIVLALPVLSVIILGISILAEAHGDKITNREYLRELRRRDAASSL